MEHFWDQVYASGEFRKHWDYRYPSQELVAFVACNLLPPGEKVLDVGCGAGREAIFLAQCGFRAIGVDLSKEALKIARERAAEANVQVDWRQGNILNLPVEDRSVVFVNDRGCFHTIPDKDREQYAKEVARVLKPGGYVLLRGCRELDAERNHFHIINETVIDRYFSHDFTRGPVLPIEMISDSGGGFKANLVVLRRK